MRNCACSQHILLTSIFYSYTKCHMLGSNDSLVLGSHWKLSTVPHCLHLVVLHSVNDYFKRSCILIEDLLPHKISGPCIKWHYCFHLGSSHGRHVSIINNRTWEGTTYSGRMFKPSFMKIRQFFQNLWRGIDIGYCYVITPLFSYKIGISILRF